jgi:D-galactarolactone isomerase
MPAGACDCHMQLFDPIIAPAKQPVGEHSAATATDYLRLQRRLCLQRNVLVQPSSYGMDHRVLLAGLRTLGPTARGVAIVHPSTPHLKLQELQSAGIVGARFDLVGRQDVDETMLEAVAQSIKPLGWHLQIHAHPRHLMRLADRLLALKVTIVIDHYALLNTSLENYSEFAVMLSRMLSSGKAWLKLSAPYIASPDSLAYEDLDSFVRQLANRHLSRLVWGTNWPHVTRSNKDKPDDAVLVNLLERWLFKNEVQSILVDNPARLYRFDSV